MTERSEGTLGGRLRGWWARESARLREGYEAQLLHDADARRGLRTSVVRNEPSIPRELRPRRVPYGELLRPVFLQFTLPCMAVVIAVQVLQNGYLVHPHRPVWGLVWLGVKALFLTWTGQWLFHERWDRLRYEAYERWRWRVEAARVEPRDAGAPSVEADADAPRIGA